jgi:C4-dicarboxylate transporter DctM subunit
MTVGPLISIWLGLMLLGMPLFLSMGFACLAYLWSNGEILLSIPQRLTATANSFPLLAAPFFMLTRPASAPSKLRL